MIFSKEKTVPHMSSPCNHVSPYILENLKNHYKELLSDVNFFS